MNLVLARAMPGFMEKVRSMARGDKSLVRERLVALHETLRTGMRLAQQANVEGLQILAVTEAEWQKAVLKATIPLEIDFQVPQVSALHRLVDLSTVEDETVASAWSSLAGSTTRRLQQEIAVGITLGESTDEIVRRVNTIGAKLPQNTGTIVKTSIADVSTKTREAVYQENSDVIGSVQLVATLDLRTTFICMDHDGDVYPVNEGPRPPFHWNCRTTTIPVTKSWRELGIDRDEIPAGTRASMNGQVSAKMTYPEWLAEQDEATQDEVLGPVRAELFRGGHVDIDGFVDSSGHVYTLDELAAREGIEEEVRRARER